MASSGASVKALVSWKKAAPSAPADPAPSAAYQHPARGTFTGCRGQQGPLGREKQQQGQEAEAGQGGRG